ncbi:nucleotide-diphospho-sugar transferase [Kockovaella imperatae]|uniref:Translation initiation factor eIF2B subunit epsilon n=1 Tax=Kockovaella imperatae TaxID=4999 RepID=A0A1Y1UAQ0_9TREE|nr:nucleotide-diphospho-sugar transferase [Kockovaella imperatae]ORX35131.1 nucleotide-diphospho-sugar transferase [Kockovaella imperatae]
MPPAGKRAQATKVESKARANDELDDTPLQAVVFADSYNRRFEVLCQDQPRILLPLCSVPLLTWTLESLSLSRVKQVFIFCGAHADKVRDFVESSPYRYTMDIQCLSSKTARSAGDALRDLDAMSVLNPDFPFILVHSPLVSNYDLSKMVEAHMARKEKDKDLIMTMGVGRGGSCHPESPVMVVDPSSSRLCFYAQNPLVPRHSRLKIPSSIFLEPPPGVDEWEVWSGTPANSSSHQGGYRDLGVDICEADVPALCTENFDYHDLRRHFVNGVLTSELLGKHIAVHLVGSEESRGESSNGMYIDRVRDTRTYGDISMDVLNRWTFPLTPDLMGSRKGEYELRKGNVYIARDHVSLGRTTALTGPLLIGARSALNEGTHIISSTLGQDCAVGPHTVITSSYIFDNVTIGDHCQVTQCIIGTGVKIGNGVKLGKGCLIGDGVTLGHGVELPDFMRVGRIRHVPEDLDSDEEDEEDEEEKNERLEILGHDSVGFIWPSEEEELAYDSDEDEDDLDPYERPKNKKYLQLGRTLSSLSEYPESCSTLSVASSSTASTPASLAASDDSLPDMPSLALDAVPPEFHAEASASLVRAYEEGHSVPNALLELRTLVMGYNAGIDRARGEVTGFLMSKMDFSGPAASILEHATQTWARWGGLAEGLSPDLTNIVLDVQAYSVSHEDARPWFGVVLRGLYESDLVPEEDLIEWRSLSAAKGEGAADKDKALWGELYAKGKAYVDVLEAMDSDSEEEDEEEEKGEEEEDDEEESD